MANEKWQDVVDRVWPKTKVELERGMKETKKLIDKGETYVRQLSDKSVKEARKLSLNLKKEKLYYDLGKATASTPKTRWDRTKKIQSSIRLIKDLDRQIRLIK